MGVFSEERRRVIEFFLTNPDGNKAAALRLIPGTQIALYIMVGGGMAGKSYAENPLDAYRNTRAGRAPYSVKDVEAMRGALVALAEAAGLDPHHLPPMQDFYGAGVF